MIPMLLNTLEAERHLRGPLLLELVSELLAVDELAPAASVARSVLHGLHSGRVGDHDFAARIADLRAQVHALCTPRARVVREATRVDRQGPSGRL
jgi:hypothetical protein